MPKKVLIAIHSNTWFVELFRFAKLLNITQKYHPVVLFGNPYPNFLDDMSSCNQEKIQNP